MSMLRIAFELRANSLKLENAPPPVAHRNPNLAHLQSAPEHRVAVASRRKHRKQQLTTVANVSVFGLSRLRLRASSFSILPI